MVFAELSIYENYCLTKQSLIEAAWFLQIKMHFINISISRKSECPLYLMYLTTLLS